MPGSPAQSNSSVLAVPEPLSGVGASTAIGSRLAAQPAPDAPLVPATAAVSKPKKVLIVVENLSVPFDRRVWRECQALTEAGYQVSTISPKGHGTDLASRETVQGVKVYRYQGYASTGGFASYLLEYGVALLQSAWLSWLVLFREGFDVIQICNPPDLLVLVALPFRLLGKRILFDQHDLSPEIYEMQGTGRKGRFVWKALVFWERFTYACSDVVMVVNESCRRIALGRGAKADRDVFIVRNGPSLENIRSAAPNPALRKGARFLLTYVGMMGPQEGIDILLRAVQRLARQRNPQDFQVLILGGGTVLEAMRSYAKELGIENLVTFGGHVDYRAVMEGIASADLCLCPDPKTPLSDKCSLVKVTEYMSLGRSLVAFDLEEVRYSAGEAALYAQPNDEADFARKVSELLDDPERRDLMGQLGRERVLRHLAWDHSKTALRAAYQHVLSHG